jgi:hypothetical protein
MYGLRTEGGDFEVEVLLLSDIRGPAPIAQTLYRETESSREKRLRLAQERRAGMLFSPAPENRPSKRDGKDPTVQTGITAENGSGLFWVHRRESLSNV